MPTKPDIHFIHTISAYHMTMHTQPKFILQLLGLLVNKKDAYLLGTF